MPDVLEQMADDRIRVREEVLRKEGGLVSEPVAPEQKEEREDALRPLTD